MKRFYKILLLLFLVVPFKVKATSLSVGLSCPSSAKAGATVTCTISGNASGGSLTGLTAKFAYTNGLSFVSFTPGSGWSNYYSSSAGFSIGNIGGKTGAITFGTLKVKVPNNAGVNSTYTVTINSLDGSDTSGNSVAAGGKTATIKVLSGNNNLSSLKLSNGTINFSANVTSYSVTINSATTVVTASLADSGASFVSGYGNRTISLAYGSHAYYIKVKAANGDIKTYTINITRPDGRSTDNSLKSLTVSSGKINFSSNVYSYDLSVAEEVSTITIDATPNHAKASLVSGFGKRTVNLKYGNNVVLVKVRAENGSERTYTLNIFRNDGRDENNYLKQLEVVGYKIVFDKEKFEYKIKVPYEQEKLEINIATDSAKAKYDINGNNLKVGENVVAITVTAENEQKRIYKINVTKLNEGELLPSADLNNLIIEGYDIDFSKDKLKYTIEVKDDKPLNIKVELANPDSIYRIIGNKNLGDKDEVTILVVSSDLETKEYVIYIVNNSLKMPIIAIIIIFILLLVIIYLYRKLINSRNNNQKEAVKNDIYLSKEKNEVSNEITVGVENPIVDPINMEELERLNNIEETNIVTTKSDVSFLDEDNETITEEKNVVIIDDEFEEEFEIDEEDEETIEIPKKINSKVDKKNKEHPNVVVEKSNVSFLDE